MYRRYIADLNACQIVPYVGGGQRLAGLTSQVTTAAATRFALAAAAGEFPHSSGFMALPGLSRQVLERHFDMKALQVIPSFSKPLAWSSIQRSLVQVLLPRLLA